MTLRESIKGRVYSYKTAYRASYDRTLGASVWEKIEDRQLCFPEEREDLNFLLDRAMETDPDTWHQTVGEVANECPREMSKDQRLRWVVRELSRRLRSC